MNIHSNEIEFQTHYFLSEVKSLSHEDLLTYTMYLRAAHHELEEEQYALRIRRSKILRIGGAVLLVFCVALIFAYRLGYGDDVVTGALVPLIIVVGLIMLLHKRDPMNKIRANLLKKRSDKWANEAAQRKPLDDA